MKRMKQKAGFTLIELLVTLTVIGVFLVILIQIICVETHITEECESMICIQDEERYISEFLFETLYSVEKIEVTEGENPLPISAFDFSYVHNCCPILGSSGEKTIRFVQDGTKLQIWEIYRNSPQIKKTIAYHVINATCELIKNPHVPHTPLIHITLTFEAGHTQKDYDLLFAMRNVS